MSDGNTTYTKSLAVALSQVSDLKFRLAAAEARVALLETLLNNATRLAEDNGDARDAHKARAEAAEARVGALELALVNLLDRIHGYPTMGGGLMGIGLKHGKETSDAIQAARTTLATPAGEG